MHRVTTTAPLRDHLVYAPIAHRLQAHARGKSALMQVLYGYNPILYYEVYYFYTPSFSFYLTGILLPKLLRFMAGPPKIAFGDSRNKNCKEIS